MARAVDLVPGAAAGSSVTFTATDQLGVYTATPIVAPRRLRRPGGIGRPGGSLPAASRGPSPAASGTASSAAPGTDASGRIAFAVDLFDVAESAIAPGPTRVLEDLGTAVPGAAPSGAPTSNGAAGAAAARPNARDEVWIPIALGVLVLLCVEWIVYHRDAVQRGWRAIGGRLGRAPRAGSG